MLSPEHLSSPQSLISSWVTDSPQSTSWQGWDCSSVGFTTGMGALYLARASGGLCAL